MVIENFRSLDLITEGLLASFEVEHDFQLPSTYRHFLLNNNGGIPSLECFDYFQLDKSRLEGSSLVSEFSYFRGGEFYTSLPSFWQMYSAKLFPIALDQSGNFIAISCTGDDLGQVYYCEREYLQEGVNPWQRVIFFIAETFEDFISGLRSVN